MRLLPLCIAACLAIALSACASEGDSAPANPRFDREGYERLRDQAQQVGSEAFAAAADAFGVAGPLPGSGTVAAQSCSGAPLGVVRLIMGSTVLYPTPGPTGAAEEVRKAWEQLGVAGTASEPDGSVTGQVTVEDVQVSFVLGESATASNGSDGESRRLTLSSDCFDVGEDLAREID